MKIVCPNCHFSKEVPVPEGATRATCPRCHQKFDLYPAEPPAEDFFLSTEEKPIMTAADHQEADRPFPRETYRPEPAADLEAMAHGLAADLQPGPPPPPGAGPGGPRPDYDRPRAAGVAWEERRGSLIGDLWTTSKEVLFSPSRFFDRMPTGAGKKGPLAYGVVIGTVGLAFSIFWQAAFTFLGMGFGLGDEAGLPITLVLAILLGVLAVSPILVLIGIYIIAAVEHFFLWLVRGGRSGFEATFRVICYTSAANLWSIVPFLGGFISGIWSIVLIIVGLKRAHRIGLFRVILAIFILPIILMILVAIGIGMLGGMFLPVD